MNGRTLLMIGLIAVVGIGLLFTVSDFFKPKASPARLYPAVAKTQIQPYTVITQDMVAQGDPVNQSDATKAGLWQVKDVIGRMTTDLIPAGHVLTALNALPIEDVRFTTDLGLEIVSFQASVDKMLAGKIRPGQLVNLYGYGNDKNNQPFTILIEPKLWVVGVSAAGQSVTNATVVPNSTTGGVTRSGGTTDRPANTITVAVPPQQAFKVIDALGAQGLNAWVTLAANQTVSASQLATPAAPTVAATQAGLPPDLALTATALWNAINSTPKPKPPATGYGWGQR
jgi:hypothetical protein